MSNEQFQVTIPEGLKAYAARVNSITRTDKEGKPLKSIGLNVECYGFYDQAQAGLLHQLPQRRMTIWVPRDSELAAKVGVRSRLMVPAQGIMEKTKKVTGRRGEFDKHQFAGLETWNVVVLNEQKLIDHSEEITKSGLSLTMAGAEEGVLAKVGKFFGSLMAPAKK